MRTEPLVTRAGIVSAATAVLALLVAFGVDLSTAQQTAIMGVVAVAAPLAVAALSRHRVTPVANDEGSEPGDVEWN